LAPPGHRQSPHPGRGRSHPRPVSLRGLGADRRRPHQPRAESQAARGRAVSWLSPTSLLGIVVAYLLFLFAVATAGAPFAPRLTRRRLRTLTYVLAASVYCTAWTFYGSVGLAANRGLEFLTIYLGPACVALLWPSVLQKLVRVSKEQRITSISDFISSR